MFIIDKTERIKLEIKKGKADNYALSAFPFLISKKMNYALFKLKARNNR